MTATIAPRTGDAFGPIEGIEYHVALAFYPEGEGVDLWDVALWDTAGVTWEGAPPLLDVSCDVVSVRIAQGRDLPLERFRPGAATVVVDDPEGIYSPWTTAPDPGEYTAVRPGIDLVVWAEIGAVVYPRFRGIVDAISDDFPDPGSGAHHVTFTAYDYLSILAAYDGLEQAEQGANELPRERLERIAASASYAGVRDFDVGTVALQATTLAKNALDEMGMVTDTETGALFASRDGVLVFLDRNGLVSDPHYSTVQAVFGEVEPEICYTGIKLASDSDKIKNVVSIANDGGTAHTLTDPDSASLYRQRTYRRFDLIHVADAESEIIAQRHLDVFAYAANRVENLDVDLAILTPAQRVDVIELDLLWRVQVRRRAQGVQIVADLQIEGIDETVTGSEWKLSLATFSADSVFGVGRWGSAKWDSGLWGY